MRRQWIGGVLMALALAACGSSNNTPPDTRPYSRPETNASAGVDTGISDTNIADAGVQPNDPDAGCDEDAMGENYCIINSPGGNGTTVARQNPVPYASCKL